MLALYRKYRPTSLDALVGEDSIKTALLSALKSGKISHSYLFTGPRGTGKTSVARILAHTINNFPYTLEDSYLDIVEIDAASNTGVDNIRDLREKALIAPSEGKYKVYIIDEVHMLSKSAFNALLKTLEEPPEHVVFILATTDLEKVPITITSRSQVFHFRLADPEIMLTHLRHISDLEHIPISDAALRLVVRRGGGSFRDSLSLLDQLSSLAPADGSAISEELVASSLGLPLDSSIAALLSAYASSDRETITKTLKDLLNEGLKPESLAESIIKSILDSPEPPFLPLLERLPSVSAPFPEAKLLLALLTNLPTDEEIPKVASGSGLGSCAKPASEEIPRVASGEARLTAEGPEPRRGVARDTRDGGLARRASAEDVRAQASDIKPTDTRPQASDSSTFNSRSFLDAIKLTNSAISLQLQKCKLIQTENTLHLYPTQKITKTILSRKNNSDILKENLPEGFELLIHDLEDLNSDPEIAKISNIMGGAQPLAETDSPF